MYLEYDLISGIHIKHYICNQNGFWYLTDGLILSHKYVITYMLWTGYMYDTLWKWKYDKH